MTTILKNSLYVIFFGLVASLSSCKEGDPGPGFDEGLKYGNVKMTISGKRPKDSVEFKAEQDFKYYPAGSQPSSDLYINTDTGEKSFNAYRLLSGVDMYSAGNYCQVRGDISKDGKLTDYQIYLNTTIIDGTKYFSLYQSVYSGDTSDDIEVKDFSFDEKTGKVKFNFTWTVNKDNSYTGYELKIVGSVDVNVFEPLNNND